MALALRRATGKFPEVPPIDRRVQVPPNIVFEYPSIDALSGYLCRAFAAGRVPDPVGAIEYYNVKAIQAAGLR